MEERTPPRGGPCPASPALIRPAPRQRACCGYAPTMRAHGATQSKPAASGSRRSLGYAVTSSALLACTNVAIERVPLGRVIDAIAAVRDEGDLSVVKRLSLGMKTAAKERTAHSARTDDGTLPLHGEAALSDGAD